MFLRGDKSAVYGFIFRRRKIKDLAYRFGPFLVDYIPQDKMMDMERKLIYAGNPFGLTVTTLIGLQGILAIAGLILGLLIVSFGIPSFLVIVIVPICFFLPIAYINNRAEKRQAEVKKALPIMVNLLSTAVSGGVELNIAFELISQTLPGVLGDELRSTIDRIETGTKRSKAFKDLSRRIGVDTLDRFVETINTAEERGGMDISLILKDFVDDIKEKQILEMKERAGKLPNKLLLPIFLCIFLPMLVIILVPTVFTLMKTM